MAKKKKRKDIPLPLLSPGVTMIDTHCHLDMDAYGKDQEEVIWRSVEAGVNYMITVGIDLESSRQAIALAEVHEAVYATAGIHPHNVKTITEKDYTELKMLAAHTRVVAYGEIGMDLVKCYAPPEVQKEHFQRQLTIAKEMELPVIIHDREAHADIVEILKKEYPFSAGGVMHCFSGDLAFAREVIDLGFFISLPGVVTFNNAHALQEVAKGIPLSSMILETDAPFLAPVPKRGKRNEPAYVLYTASHVAELRGVSLEDIALQTTENAQNLFKINV